ncbi:MAG: riboflavin biosynthesis protein RibF, partial [Pseudomonadota bacterium]
MLIDAAGSIGLSDLPPALTGGTVAIGNFDGVHRGHQAVLSEALKGPAPRVALTFEPHPRAFFSGQPIFRLTPLITKARLICAFGLDRLVVVPFDERLASQSADVFMDEVLGRQLNCRHVAVGYDFKFGKGRGGNAAYLHDQAAGRGFSVTVVPALEGDGGKVSSSQVRDRLGAGEVEAAAQDLGYHYQVTAPVVHGHKRGRTLGFPTANQALEPAHQLRHGIYAVRAKIAGAWHGGVASYGRRPTFDDGAPLLETYVFD